MADKQEFVFHVAETRHFEFRVWAQSEEAAREAGQEIWRKRRHGWSMGVTRHPDRV